MRTCTPTRHIRSGPLPVSPVKTRLPSLNDFVPPVRRQGLIDFNKEQDQGFPMPSTEEHHWLWHNWIGGQTWSDFLTFFKFDPTNAEDGKKGLVKLRGMIERSKRRPGNKLTKLPPPTTGVISKDNALEKAMRGEKKETRQERHDRLIRLNYEKDPWADFEKIKTKYARDDEDTSV